MEAYLKIGVLTTPHGVHGEIKVYPTTDDVRRFKGLKQVYFLEGTSYVQKKLISSRPAGEFAIIHFEGIDTPEEVAKYRKRDIYIDRNHAVSLSQNEYYIADLIGIEIDNEENNRIGVLKDVLATGANDVYIITLDDGRELLLPAIKECILAVDIENAKMRIHILPGLLDEES